MKLYIIKLLTLFLSLFFLSLIHYSKGIGSNCDEQLYWFKVRITVNNVCADIVLLSQLVLIPESSNPSLPNEVPFTFSGNDPYGCIDQDDYACALGYSRDQIELVNGFWQPKTVNGFIIQEKCCVRRSSSFK